MTFLNTALLFGTAAFAIPLVIHLLNRSRFKTLDWGAMLFLDEALRANSRRFEWQKWLLLLMRCAIPICLALCMARPLLRSGIATATLPGKPSVATSLLIDNSLSMEAPIDDGSSRSQTVFERAQQSAIEMLETAPRSSRWAVHAIGSQAEEAMDIGARDLQRQPAFIRALPHATGTADLLSSIDSALTKLAMTPDSRRRIVLISDFQKTMCQAIEPSQVIALRRRLEAMSNPAEVVFLAVGQSKTSQSSLDNLTVRVDSQTSSVVGVGQNWEVRLIIKNFGPNTARDVKLVLSIDGVATSSKTLEVPGRAESQITFGMLFSESGAHHIEATLEANDVLTADNRATWSVLALGAIPVLIIDPTMNDQQGIAESEFLQAALTPFAEIPEQNSNLFRVSRISPDELTTETIYAHRIVVLANVAKLSIATVEPLIRRVQSGGILLIFSGDRIEPDWYNRHFASVMAEPKIEAAPASEVRFLPCLFDSEPTLLPTDGEGMTLRRDLFQDPAIRFLSDARGTGLDNVKVRGWYRLLPNAKAAGADSSNLLSFVNGDCFLAERAVGQGKVLQCATTCNDRWTNWPLRPIYLPMLQQILLNTTPPFRWPINVETGQQLNWPSAQTRGWLSEPRKDRLPSDSSLSEGDESRSESGEAAASFGSWCLPDARRREASSVIAELPGIYTIEGMGERALYLSAQAPLAESDLAIESEAGIRSLAERLGATIVGSSEALMHFDRRGDRELWRWFLVGLLVLLFGELFLQRYLAGGAA